MCWVGFWFGCVLTAAAAASLGMHKVEEWNEDANVANECRVGSCCDVGLGGGGGNCDTCSWNSLSNVDKSRALNSVQASKWPLERRAFCSSCSSSKAAAEDVLSSVIPNSSGVKKTVPSSNPEALVPMR